MKIAKTWVAGLLLGFGTLLSACDGGDGDGGTAPTTAEFVGKWLLRQTVAKGSFTMKAPALGIDTTQRFDTTENYTGSTYYMDFKSDNTYVGNMPDSDYGPDLGIEKKSALAVAVAGMESGTWTLQGSSLTTISNPTAENPYKDTTVQKVTLDGGTLTVKFAFDTTATEEGFTISSSVDATIKMVK